MRRPDTKHHTKRGGAFERLLSVRTWLYALAVVPLLGATGLVYGESGHIRESRADTAIVADATDELIDLMSLRTSLLDENAWSQSATDGASLASLRWTVDVDARARQTLAATEVDAHLGALVWPEFQSELATQRESNADSSCMTGDYRQLMADIKRRTDDTLDDLLQTIGRSGASDATLHAFRVFEAASAAREFVALRLANEANANGALCWPSEERGVNDDYEYFSAVAKVAARSVEHSQVRQLLEPLDFGTEVRLDLRAFDDPSAAGATNRLSLPPSEQWEQLLGVHDELVATAAADFEAASQVLSDTLRRSAAIGLGRIGVLLAASMLFAFGLVNAVGRPLGSLADGARRLRDGSNAGPLKPSGPTEVRQAMLAINEAAAHISLAERQARVLAEGQLSDPVLSQNAPGALGQSLQATVRTLASSLSQREEFRRRLSHEATHDGLTQLANRKASLAQLNKSVARTVRSGSTLAVMFVDLDGFKEVNDDHGHPVGDAVLWTLGKRLAGAVRAGDHVGRLGGDEFLVVAEPVAGVDEARNLAAIIAQQISEPMNFPSCTITITASIGLAVTERGKGLTATELLYDADLAVYRAKELGRGRIELCDESLHSELLERSATEDALRQAIERNELSMHYQPILNAQTARLSSLEALIRWDRPGHGMTPPDQFIPIAERSDLIREVDNWVVSHVVGQLREWSSDPILRDVPIAINISGRHLSSATFVEDIVGPVRLAGIDPRRLILEVTESALVDDLELAAAKLQLLRDESIRIAIDDFGTGYTSLGHLRSLPIDILKIDRSFINDPSASSLVKLIIDTGHLIGVSVTSEGIETADQAAHFTDLGSDSLQGYLFARPMVAAAVERRLKTSASDQLPFLGELPAH